MKAENKGAPKPGSGTRAKRVRKPGTGHRSSTRLITRMIREKRAVEKNIATVASCATRTVEMPETHTVGDEKHKLLFALALGMIPRFDKKVEPNLVVRVEKLDPILEAEAKAKTENRINEIMLKNLLESQKTRPVIRNVQLPAFTPLMLLPEEDEAREMPSVEAELIDLVSEDEGDEEILEICDEGGEEIEEICDEGGEEIEEILETDIYFNPGLFYEQHDSCLSPSPEPEDIIDLTSSDDEGSDYSCDNIGKWQISLENPTGCTCAQHDYPTPSPSPKQLLITDFGLFSEATTPTSSLDSHLVFQQIENHFVETSLGAGMGAKGRKLSKRKGTPAPSPKRSSPRLSTLKSAALSSELGKNQKGIDTEAWMLDCRIISSSDVVSKSQSVPNQMTENYYQENTVSSTTPEIVPDLIITID